MKFVTARRGNASDFTSLPSGPSEPKPGARSSTETCDTLARRTRAPPRETAIGVNADDEQIVVAGEQFLRGVADRPIATSAVDASDCGHLERRGLLAPEVLGELRATLAITSRASSIASATFCWNA